MYCGSRSSAQPSASSMSCGSSRRVAVSIAVAPCRCFSSSAFSFIANFSSARVSLHCHPGRPDDLRPFVYSLSQERRKRVDVEWAPLCHGSPLLQGAELTNDPPPAPGACLPRGDTLFPFGRVNRAGLDQMVLPRG